MATTSFFVPGSQASSYVSGQRDEQGANVWDRAEGEIGMQKQLALQSLGQQYDSTINNAYSNYLVARRGVQGSAMGQGYKEEYQRMMDEGLQMQTAQASLNAQQGRMEIEQAAGDMQGQLQKAFQQEVGYMDQLGGALVDYARYLSGLRDNLGGGMFSSQEIAMMQRGNIDSLYQKLFDAKPYGSITDDFKQEGWLDQNQQSGLDFLSWLRSSSNQTTMNSDWMKWINAGGYVQFQTAISKGLNR